MSWLLADVTSWILADVTSSSDAADLVKTLGFPIVVALFALWLIGSGKIPRQSEIDNLREDKKRLEAQVDAFSKQYETVVIPTMHDTVTTVQQVAAASERQIARFDAIERAVSSLDQSIRVVERLVDTRSQGGG